jgi:hypothetical protein
MIEYLARPLADAFMQVGVYVAVMVALFGALRWRYGDRVTDGLTRHRRWGPLAGAVLGVSPGCGGAIILMPLYVRGKVSFGTVVAALAATMGDSSWVIIAADPALALRIHLLLFVVGLATGYLVDAAGFAPRTRRTPAASVSGGTAGPAMAGRRTPESVPVAAATTTAVALASTRENPAPIFAAFWSLTTPAFLVSVPVVFQVVDPSSMSAALGGLDPYLVLGVAGTLTALLVFGAGRGRFADDSLDTAQAQSIRQTMRHSAHEASFITVWVAAAYLGWQILSTATGFDGSQLVLAGVVGVLAGAVIGLVPGCAVQIVFTGLYVSGGLPLSTLVANAVSQDGDALIPLAALDRRAAVQATVITTIPAIITGLALLALTG